MTKVIVLDVPILALRTLIMTECHRRRSGRWVIGTGPRTTPTRNQVLVIVLDVPILVKALRTLTMTKVIVLDVLY